VEDCLEGLKEKYTTSYWISLFK